MTLWSDYSPTPSDNTSPPPLGAPEGMFPSAVNDTIREMMSVINQLGTTTQSTFAGLGSMSTQNSDDVSITGGSVTGVTLAGEGSGIYNLNAANLAIGTVPQARMQGYYPISVDQSTHANNADTIGGVSISSIMIPVGGVIMYYGSLASVDTNQWALCDGTRGTPNMMGVFPFGVSSGPGSRGGALSATTDTQGNHSHGGSVTPYALTLNEIPSHDHGIGGAPVVQNDPNSPGGLGFGTYKADVVIPQAQGGGAAHTHAIGADGNHAHNISLPYPPYVGIMFLMRVA